MAKWDPRPDLQQPLGLGRRQGLRADPERVGRAPHECRVAGRIGCRQQHQTPGRLGQPLESPHVAVLDTQRQVPCVGKREPPGQLCSRQAPRQIQERERIAARLGDNPIANELIESPRDDGGEQGSGVRLAESLEHQFRQADQLALLARLPHGEDDRHRFCQQPSRDESKHLRRGAVEPLRVIDDTEQLLLLGDFRKQAERGQGDEEPIGGRAGRQAERGAQCVALRCRETTEPGEHRGAQLMQSRERQLHLRLDGHAPGNAKTRRLADAVAQKRGLAHTRLATNDEHCALALADVLEQPVQRSPLAGPTPELRRTVRGHSRDQATSRRCVPQTGSADQGLSLARRAARSATLTPPAAKRLEANREQH